MNQCMTVIMFYLYIIYILCIRCLIESDEELFEDNPEEYIRKDVEGSGTVFNTYFIFNQIPSNSFSASVSLA